MDMVTMKRMAQYRWRFGYCDDLITKLISHPDIIPKHGPCPICTWLDNHVLACETCRKAELLKFIETVVSVNLGLGLGFQNGDCIRDHSHYDQHFQKVLDDVRDPKFSKLMLQTLNEEAGSLLKWLGDDKNYKDFLDWKLGLNIKERELQDWPVLEFPDPNVS